MSAAFYTAMQKMMLRCTHVKVSRSGEASDEDDRFAGQNILFATDLAIDCLAFNRAATGARRVLRVTNTPPL